MAFSSDASCPLPAAWLRAGSELPFRLNRLRGVASTAYSSLPPWLAPSFFAAWERQGAPCAGARIVDCTANVGIELLLLVSHYRLRGFAYEVDLPTFHVLARNISELGLDGRVIPIQCDSAAVVLAEPGAPHALPEVDIVYFDPPWGGRAYKDVQEVSLALGGHDIVELATAAVARAAVVVVKAPLNLEPAVFVRLLERGLDVQIEPIYSSNGRLVFELYFIRRDRPAAPVRPTPRVALALNEYFTSRFLPCIPRAQRPAARAAFGSFLEAVTPKQHVATLQALGAVMQAGGPTNGTHYAGTCNEGVQRRAVKRAANVVAALGWPLVAGSYLDVGGGDESITVAVAEAIDEITDATCVDPGVSADRPCAKPLTSVQAQVEMAPLPPSGGRYGLVTCLMSLHHVGDQRAAAARLAEVCAPGAQVVVREHALGVDRDWTPPEEAQYLDTIHRVFQILEGAPRPDEVVTFYRTPRELSLIMQNAGFVEVQRSAPSPRGALWNYTCTYARLPLLPEQEAQILPSPRPAVRPRAGGRGTPRGGKRGGASDGGRRGGQRGSHSGGRGRGGGRHGRGGPPRPASRE